MSDLKRRLDRLESDKGAWVIVRECPRCKRLVVWSDVVQNPDAEDLCQRHRPAPPPRPGDIVIVRAYGQATDR
jgi:hypothetical protein